MSALAFVRCGDGVLGVSCPRQGCRASLLGAHEYGERRRGFVRCSDGVLAVPGGCAKGGEPNVWPCSARSTTASGGVASCGAATACWLGQVAALSAGSQRGAVLSPARRSRLAQRGLAGDWQYASPTAPLAKPL